MTCFEAFLVAVLAAVAGPDELPLPHLGQDPPPLQDDGDLQRRIDEKRKTLRDLQQARKEEEDALKKELSALWEERLGPIPRAIGITGKLDYAVWGHAIRVGDGLGMDVDFSIGSWGGYTEDGVGVRFLFSPIPAPDNGMLGFGIRRFNARDELTGGRVEVLTYKIVQFRSDFQWPIGFGTGYEFTFGLTRLAGRGPGGDRDTALDFTVTLPTVTFEVQRNLRVGLGVTWDFLKTNFNQNRTHTVFSVFPSFSLDVHF